MHRVEQRLRHDAEKSCEVFPFKHFSLKGYIEEGEEIPIRWTLVANLYVYVQSRPAYVRWL